MVNGEFLFIFSSDEGLDIDDLHPRESDLHFVFTFLFLTELEPRGGKHASYHLLKHIIHLVFVLFIIQNGIDGVNVFLYYTVGLKSQLTQVWIIFSWINIVYLQFINGVIDTRCVTFIYVDYQFFRNYCLYFVILVPQSRSGGYLEVKRSCFLEKFQFSVEEGFGHGHHYVALISGYIQDYVVFCLWISIFCVQYA